MLRIIPIASLIFFLWPLNAQALLEASASPNLSEWQLTLDVIKGKAKVLMERNSQLMDENKSLVEEYKFTFKEVSNLVL